MFRRDDLAAAVESSLVPLPLFPDTDALTAQPVCAPAVTAAVARLAAEDDAEARGAVFTRIEVVEFILDLVGYTPDRPLHACRLLEPAAGCGEFLRVAVVAACSRPGERLVAPATPTSPGRVVPALRRPVELHHDGCRRARAALGSWPQPASGRTPRRKPDPAMAAAGATSC